MGPAMRQLRDRITAVWRAVRGGVQDEQLANGLVVVDAARCIVCRGGPSPSLGVPLRTTLGFRAHLVCLISHPAVCKPSMN